MIYFIGFLAVFLFSSLWMLVEGEESASWEDVTQISMYAFLLAFLWPIFAGMAILLLFFFILLGSVWLLALVVKKGIK